MKDLELLRRFILQGNGTATLEVSPSSETVTLSWPDGSSLELFDNPDGTIGEWGWLEEPRS